MNGKFILSIFLIIFGVMALACSSISFKTPGESVLFLGMRVENRENHFIPPVFAALTLVGGIILLLLKPRSA